MITSLIVTQIVLPLVLIASLAIVPALNVLAFSLHVLVTIIYLIAIALMGIWLFPPWWTPYLYGMLLAVVLMIRLRRIKFQRSFPSNWLGWVVIIAFVAFGVFANNEAVQSWVGRFPPPIPTVDLAFPLQGGDYLIANGGSNIRINPHLKTLDESVPRFRAYRGQSYGVDIIQINPFGLQAKGIFPADPANYQIYGEPVFAPCSGTIIQVTDGLPDMKIPEIDAVNRAGNHVILRCDNIDVLLAHFRPQSLLVQTGMDVKTGDPIAKVGNSGTSNEPHLHISSQRPGTPNAPFSGEPLPMLFDGRYLTRGDRVTMF